jgi:RecQ-mediated genome instability protein 1
MANPPTLAQLTHSLTTQGLPTPHPSFLTPILTIGVQKKTPLAGVTATAKLRLLCADLSLPGILASTPPPSVLPANITDVQIAARKLDRDVVVQVLDVEDIGKSKWEQIELLESERKGETVKGREIIRVVPSEENQQPSSAATQAIGTQTAGNAGQGGKEGPYKLLMQDCKGNRVYGFELTKVAGIGYPPGMRIGCKILLKRGSQVARGMVLLEPERTVVLGGKIEELDKAWREGWEQRLREQVDKEARERRQGDGDEDLMDED